MRSFRGKRHTESMLSRNNLAADLYLKTQKYGERSKLDLVDG